MKKEKIIDLTKYREPPSKTEEKEPDFPSEDLKTAIQHLIRRLRESNPIKQSQ